jgi:hypothetical protein
VTIPVAEPTVATSVLELVHVPPAKSLKVVVPFWHTVVLPVMVGDGCGVTKSVSVTGVPHAVVYEIMVVPVVPGATVPLVTNPVDGPEDIIVATAELLVLQTPPPVPSLSVMVTPPEHIVVAPDIGGGPVLTVTVATAAIPQPVE